MAEEDNYLNANPFYSSMRMCKLIIREMDRAQSLFLRSFRKNKHEGN